MKAIQVGLLGLGTVGSGVYQLLEERSGLIEGRTGLRFEVKRILVRDKGRQRSVEVPPSRLTTDPGEILGDPEIPLVVELMGGISPAGRYLLQAVDGGRHVVTANKALLAERGEELFSRARERRVSVGFEASVAGGIPILKAIREGFVGNRILEIYGIINGTSNFILSEMTQRGAAFQEILAEAQRQGYAERDPKMDIDGTDAAQKLSILLLVCYGGLPPGRAVYVEGIDRITPFDLEAVGKQGFAVKLLAIAKQQGGKITARVHPTLVPKSHPLADVSGVFNAVYLKGDPVGEAMFYGRGAGMMPTASAVVSDMVAAGQAILRGGSVWEPPPSGTAAFGSIDDLATEYYLRFSVVDRPGVLARIASLLGANQISISTVHQYGASSGSKVPIVITTHEARESNVRKAIEEIDRLESVLDKTMLIRVERL